MKTLILIVSLISVHANAIELLRTLDYKSHKMVCTVRNNEVITETITRSGEFKRIYKRGQFFENRFVSEWIHFARYEPMREYIHVRESIPNVTIVADGLLVTWSAGHTLMRSGQYSAALRHTVEDSCGPFEQH